MSDLVIYFMGVCVCLFSVIAVTARGIFHCSMSLAMALISIAGIYFALDAQFLGVIQILVYVGGIVTLFVFAIKLTASPSDRSIRQVNKQFWPAALVSSAFLVILLRLFSKSPLMNLTAPDESTSLSELGKILMTKYALPFEFMSIVLLAALVGAIVIGKVKS